MTRTRRAKATRGGRGRLIRRSLLGLLAITAALTVAGGGLLYTYAGELPSLDQVSANRRRA